MSQISKTTEITLSGHTYTVTFPNTGQFIDIENLKSRFGDGMYSYLLGSTINAEYARVLIDAISTFSVLIPELKVDLNVKAIMDLDMLHSSELVQAYKSQYLTWYNENMEIILKVNKS